MAGSREDGELVQASEGRGRSWSIPLPGKRYTEALRTSSALAAAGAYVVTDPVNVFRSRLFHLYIKATSAAIGNIVSIVPEVSLDPSGADDTFYTIGISDGVVTLADLGVAPGGNYEQYNFGGVIFTPMNILTPAAITASDILAMSVTIDVNQGYWIRIRVAEAGITGTPSTLQLDYAKST